MRFPEKHLDQKSIWNDPNAFWVFGSNWKKQGPVSVNRELKKRDVVIVWLLTFALFMVCGMVFGCRSVGHETTHITVRPFMPEKVVAPGEYPLGLGGYRLVNRSVIWRDGYLYIPEIARSGAPLPLLVWLHGGGGNAQSFRYLYSLAEEIGVVLLALDARHNTWDGIDSPFGPDVRFIDEALRHTFERVAIDPKKIALGGLSHGASYALAIGRVNGDLFTHLIAIAPGLLRLPAPETGSPRIFVGHGTRDNVYHYLRSRRIIVPMLKNAGYDVTYLEFDGPHWLPAPVGRKVLMWLDVDPTSS